jgi:hypothetical protein
MHRDNSALLEKSNINFYMLLLGQAHTSLIFIHFFQRVFECTEFQTAVEAEKAPHATINELSIYPHASISPSLCMFHERVAMVTVLHLF